MKVAYAGAATVLVAVVVLYLTVFQRPPLIQMTPDIAQADAGFAAALKDVRAFPATVQVQQVSVDPHAITQDQQTLKFTLFDRPINATRVRSEEVTNPDGTKSLVWYGNLEGYAEVEPEIPQWQDPLNSITLVKHDQTITGAIRQGRQLYELRPVGADRHVVIMLDGTKMPPERDSDDRSRRSAPNAVAPRTTSVDAAALTTIDVMTVVPQKIVSEYQGDMLGLTQLAVAQANQSYINSRIGITLRLVAYQVTDYVPNVAFPALDLIRLSTPNDGFMDDSLTVRDEARADVVVYLFGSSPAEDGTQYCGQALQYGSTADTAFAMVNYECIVNFTFAHEIGHLQYARHEIASDPSVTPYPFAHAYRFTAGGNTWHTIVGTQPHPPTSQRLNLWSNPDIRYEGVPMGDAETADNHRVLELTKEAISSYR
ncbi:MULTISPECIES: zinc-dependent metalloprotease family protein [unclassified Pseudomonas]|uniref:zinc-dependent metalloprotease family protein n=1 Tax=unclassified Pseudomonas TaxID=196821 RepID=UPI0025F7F365|nr:MULTISPECIES: zinc-dependent metalloprotease family protein [unclassified Pseudomonas]